MDLIEALRTLSEYVSVSATLVSGAKDVHAMLAGGNADADVARAIERLRADSSPEEIVAAAVSSLPAKGGRLFVAAGNDSGGTVRIDGATMSGGDGRDRGGDAVFKAGDGGMHGQGGDLVIGPGTYKGGDAKG